MIEPFYYLLHKGYLLTVEVRRRLVLLTINFTCTVLLACSNKEALLFSLSTTIHQGSPVRDNYFILTTFPEIFLVYVLILFLSLVYTGVPQATYQVFSFLAPALRFFELNFFKGMLRGLFVGWLLALFITHMLVIPFANKFFMSLAEEYNVISPDKVFLEASLVGCSLFYRNSLFSCLICLEIYVVAVKLSTVFLRGSPKRTNQCRRFYYCVFCAAICLVTPPEPFLQLLQFLAVSALYECNVLSIYFSLVRQPVKTKQQPLREYKVA